MKLDLSKVISAASAGLMLGALGGCGGSQPAAENPASAGEAAEAKACCRGLNECAGKGGCAVDGKNACAGKNECKHKGGCNHHCPK